MKQNVLCELELMVYLYKNIVENYKRGQRLPLESKSTCKVSHF